MVNFEKEAKLQVIMPLGMVLLGLLAAIVLPNFIGQSDKARVRAVQAHVEMLTDALEKYRRDVGAYPSAEQGLEALRIKPKGVPRWDGPYLQKGVPNDPWGRPYIYKFPGKVPGKPEIVSYGADGAPGGTGDNADISSG